MSEKAELSRYVTKKQLRALLGDGVSGAAGNTMVTNNYNLANVTQLGDTSITNASSTTILIGGGGGGGGDGQWVSWYSGIEFVIDGLGAVISTGQKGHLEVPFNCTIQRVTILADQSGSIVVDLWKDTYANFPPTDADSITASAPPTLSSAQNSQDSTLTGWSTTLTRGDILAFNVDSCATITRVTLSLSLLRGA